MRVLGVDPGLGTTGYAVIDFERGEPRLVEAGAIRAAPGNPLSERLRSIAEDLREVIRELKPGVVGLESLFSTHRFPRSALQMAHVRGVVCLVAAEAGLEVVDIAPSAVKSAVVGTGGATKEQVQATVQAIYALDAPPRPADVADALAIATAVAYRLLRPGRAE